MRKRPSTNKGAAKVAQENEETAEGEAKNLTPIELAKLGKQIYIKFDYNLKV